ncbi:MULTISPECIES: DUF1816 domain-containing protein [Floridanema]|uniref:DUF1816 domain-containing protein n=2 Tax=Floridanema TaxID=3396149 RepID=A0ABV4YHR1_9CYAN
MKVAVQLELSNEDMPWWVEITTAKPFCVYYFGSFQHFVEAKKASLGYVEDLESENSQVLEVLIKRCQPDVLTICEQAL